MRSTPDKTRAWRLRSRPILPVSKKRRREMRERRKTLAVVFERDGGCVMRPGGSHYAPQAPACGGFYDGHEPLRRSQGGDPLDPDQVVTLCRRHHDFVHGHVGWAQEHGLLVRSSRQVRVKR